MTAKGKHRGRPRRANADAAILDAAAQLVSQRGYRGMTVDAVAATAGVSAPTVYLRYPTKHDLAVAAIGHRSFLTDLQPTGDSEVDLLRLLEGLTDTARSVGLGILGVVLAEEPEHPELLQRWREVIGSVATDAMRDLVERGQQSGQLRRELDAAIVADLVIGAYIARYLHEGEPSDAWRASVIATLWPALANEPALQTGAAVAL